MRRWVFAGLASLSFAASAGPFQDDLSQCLVRSSTTEDRSDLVRWIFAAASAHPAVSSIVTVSEDQRGSATQKAAALLVRLLTEDCLKQTQDVAKYEGMEAVQSAFQTLGQIAGQELFASAEVGAELANLQKHVDESKLEAAFGKHE